MAVARATDFYAVRALGLGTYSKRNYSNQDASDQRLFNFEHLPPTFHKAGKFIYFRGEVPLGYPDNLHEQYQPWRLRILGEGSGYTEVSLLAGSFGQELGGPFLCERFREKVPLGLVATEVAQLRQLFLRLHTFRYNLHIKRMGQRHYARHYGRVAVTCQEVFDERAIYLQAINREAVEVRERGVTRAEIVYRQLRAQPLQAFEYLHVGLGLAHDHALSYLQVEVSRVQPGLFEYSRNFFDQLGTQDLPG